MAAELITELRALANRWAMKARDYARASKEEGATEAQTNYNRGFADGYYRAATELATLLTEPGIARDPPRRSHPLSRRLPRHRPRRSRPLRRPSRRSLMRRLRLARRSQSWCSLDASPAMSPSTRTEASTRLSRAGGA